MSSISKDKVSVCIPIFNWDVTELVFELHRQALVSGADFEFVLMDDGSSDIFKQKNRLLQSLPNLIYIELDENVGRSKVRNLLVERSSGDYLIMMDCDAGVVRKDFFSSYLSCIPADVVVGGTVYGEKPSNEKVLRWKYGVEREQKTKDARSARPNASFSPFNFFVRKDVLLSVSFDESISGYGHEDTLLGWALSKKGIVIKHIDNPLMHLGLDDTEVFISKTKNSVLNLKQICNRIKDDSFSQQVTLLSFQNKLKRFFVWWMIKPFLLLFRPFFVFMLKRSNPCLLFMDLYKLSFL